MHQAKFDKLDLIRNDVTQLTLCTSVLEDSTGVSWLQPGILVGVVATLVFLATSVAALLAFCPKLKGKLCIDKQTANTNGPQRTNTLSLVWCPLCAPNYSRFKQKAANGRTWLWLRWEQSCLPSPWKTELIYWPGVISHFSVRIKNIWLNLSVAYNLKCKLTTLERISFVLLTDAYVA